MTTMFWLWLTICPGYVLTDPGCKTTERYLCHEELCLELIREKKPTSAIWGVVK
jgi:hypothetical protein